MIRAAFTGLILLAALARTALAWPQTGPPAPAQLPHPAVARIIVPEHDGTSYGSGTLVDVKGQYGLVVTNWHVIRDWSPDSGDVEVVFPDGFRSFARAVKADREWDLAALVVWRPPGVEPVMLASRPPRPGDVLTIAGHGQGRYRAVTGRCIKYLAPAVNRPAEMVEVSVQARQGDSGGPIFNDRGELAGVLWGASFGTTSGSYNARVQTFLASLVPEVDGRGAETIAARPVAPPARAASSQSGVWRAVETDPTLTPLPKESGSLAAVAQQNEMEIADFATDEESAARDANSQKSIASATIPRAAAANEEDRRSSVPPIPPASFDNTSLPTASIGAADASSEEASTQQPSSARPLTWQDVAGETFWDQAKSLLAVVGVFAVLFLFFRLIGD